MFAKEEEEEEEACCKYLQKGKTNFLVCWAMFVVRQCTLHDQFCSCQSWNFTVKGSEVSAQRSPDSHDRQKWAAHHKRKIWVFWNALAHNSFSKNLVALDHRSSPKSSSKKALCFSSLFHVFFYLATSSFLHNRFVVEFSTTIQG
jgi:hypothetical protein